MGSTTLIVQLCFILTLCVCSASKILVTGGAGYIGSHVVVELLTQGHEVVVVDDLSNSHRESLDRVEEITEKSVTFYKVDLNDATSLAQVFFNESPVDSVIHFAGFKAVGESTEHPLQYYANNIGSAVSLLKVMEQFHCYNLIFSSSATVYGTSKSIPYTEDLQAGVGISNPYGKTKYFIEELLKDMANANDSKWRFVILRYFNPIGAHESGKIGEDPNGIPNNLMPYITQVCIGRREFLTIYGDDYNTRDGTGERDYIHVVDLATGHVAALNKISTLEKGEAQIYNLGRGVGYTVKEVLNEMENAAGKKIPFHIGERRPGDLAKFYASVEKARTELNWVAQKSLADMCRDSWNWQRTNPNGYA